MKVLILTLAVLFCLTVPATRAVAQEPVHTFADMASKVKPDLRIQVTDSRDETTDGVLTSVSNGTVILALPSGQTKSFSEQNVRRIDERKEFDGIGTLVGTGLGVGLGWLLAQLPCDTPGCGGPPLFLAGMALGGGLGVMVDVKRMYKPLFLASDKHGRFQVAPFITPQRKGVLATLRF